MNMHFIGIGGIGASALAQYYLSKGHKVSGSDLVSSEIIEILRSKGAKIHIGKHKKTNLPRKVDKIIYTTATQKDNPELIKSKALSYPQALGELTKNYFTIAISGTHGKSTTSAMISLILAKSGLDPTVIIGTKLKEFDNSNFRKGKSKYLIIEADEYRKAFLNYNPQILVLTNIEEDHLDYYKNLNNILNAFKNYLSRIDKKGWLITNKDDRNIENLLKKQKLNKKLKIKKYFIKQKEAKKIKKIIKIPGEHNVSNALAALQCARVLKIKDEQTLKILSQFKGSWRRFEALKTKKNILISDYAHHPTEVEKTLQATREKFPLRKIRCVFQPHQHLRTFYFFNDFIRVIENAPVDEIILCEVYDVPGREEKKISLKATSKEIEKKVKNKNLIYKKNLIQAFSYIKKTHSKNEVLIIMGAGDIYNLFLKLKRYFKNL
jgi:UDP-N-acetylmuramate--alanine ligase